ncbi:MAG: DEAD/DEAH box helicase, partial [Promicromonosporaceae bacterium]|nr:DEAD/DEAH box helicase [Promicromonosporaceae bacterium]
MRAERLTHVRTLPARQGVTTDWPVWADPQLVAAYQALGVERPWTHQVEAAEAAWQGRQVALATSTGSGKSLAFWLPALTAIRRGKSCTGSTSQDDGGGSDLFGLEGRRGTVLYLSPTKALAADQLAGLQRLLDAMPAASERSAPRVATCDGDTPTDDRRWVQDYADVVLTNPDFLHFSLLPNHRRWARLLRSLRFVVVDEGHTYRGVFGAHISLVLRRLARLAEHYGNAGQGRRPLADSAEPPPVIEPVETTGRGQPGLTFVVASATSAAPAASAARLLGVAEADVTAVTTDGSPSGRRTIALWQPPEIIDFEAAASHRSAQSGGGSQGGVKESVLAQGDDWVDADPWAIDPWSLPDPLNPGQPEVEQPAVVTVQGAAAHPRRTATAEVADLLANLAAAGARTLAFTRSRRGAETVAQAARSRSGLASRIAAYRGGFLPEERRELERAIRTGDLLGLATTNAL